MSRFRAQVGPEAPRAAAPCRTAVPQCPVGTAFVGAAASALVLAEELRALHDGPRFEVVSWSLRSPEHIEAVVNPAPGPNTNLGYVTAA